MNRAARLLGLDRYESLEEGLRERPASAKPSDVLIRKVRDAAAQSPDSLVLIRLLARFGDRSARDRLWEIVGDSKRPMRDRETALAVFVDGATPASSRQLIYLVKHDGPTALRVAALDGWARVGNEDQGATLLSLYSQLPKAIQSRLRSVLLSRKSWATLLLRAVDKGWVPAKDFSPEELFAVSAHHDKDLDALVLKHWGNIRSATPGEKLAIVRRYNNDLRAAKGDVNNGRLLFTKNCAACHKLNGEGGAIGPDLTHANRADRDYLLISLVDPSAVIRKEYLSYTAETADNRLVTGVITAQTATSVTLTNSKAEATTLKRDEIVSLRESPVSLMPEGLLTPLRPQELRDLFAYLQQPARK